jgi:hypothetical protein
MAETPDDLAILLAEVRKTISDNQLFLEKLLVEALEVDSEDDAESATGEEDFEEL